jgi:DNA-binding MarR family transcriptional regulator
MSDINDKRKLNLSLTESGVDILNAARNTKKDKFNKVVSTIGIEKIKGIIALLNELADVVVGENNSSNG